MRWSAFCAHLADFYEQAEQADPSARRGVLPTFPPPSHDELRDTQWGGDGPDPLEELFSL